MEKRKSLRTTLGFWHPSSKEINLEGEKKGILNGAKVFSESEGKEFKRIEGIGRSIRERVHEGMDLMDDEKSEGNHSLWFHPVGYHHRGVKCDYGLRCFLCSTVMMSCLSLDELLVENYCVLCIRILNFAVLFGE
ncbi:unnamed protein product [Sphenostylis stenocarpa]|uniref:Uncharacterized protein n=1 Tax=Sphenostylis stenocarpa TaxID=92480 RepID=A0AA86S095_9FABA|nr:unnamed protein product [Sphenostylis stenocarpa]